MADNNFYTKGTFFQLLKSNTPCAGTVKLCLPNVSGSGSGSEIIGFLENDFNFKMSNSWGSVLPDMKTMRQFGQILGNQNILTWIASSAAAWESSQPIEFSITMYLVTLVRDQSPSIVNEAREIMKMLALHVGDDTNFAEAKIHGGYKADYMMSNSSFAEIFTSTDDINETLKALASASDEVKGEKVGTIASAASNLYSSGTYPQGTIKLLINDSLKFENLLLTDASFTHSSAYVNASTPLFIKSDLSFRTSWAPTTKDIDNLYGLLGG